MRVVEEKVDHDSVFRHDRKLAEKARLRILLGPDRVFIGELSHATLDRRQSWMLRPVGFPLFVKDPGARHDNQDTTKARAIARMIVAYELREAAVEVSGFLMHPFGTVGGMSANVPLDADGKPTRTVYAPTSVYMGVEDGKPFELRVARREASGPGYVIGWEGFGEASGLPVYAMGCSSPAEALETVLRVRNSPLGQSTSRPGARVSGSIVALGSLVDLMDPGSIPVGLHHETHPDGVVHVSPRPGETLYRIVPASEGFDVVTRDGARIGTASTSQLALSMLGINSPDAEDEPSSSPTP